MASEIPTNMRNSLFIRVSTGCVNAGDGRPRSKSGVEAINVVAIRRNLEIFDKALATLAKASKLHPPVLNQENSGFTHHAGAVTR